MPLTIAERNQLKDLVQKYTTDSQMCECTCEDDHDGEGPISLDACPHFDDARTLAKALQAITRGL